MNEHDTTEGTEGTEGVQPSAGEMAMDLDAKADVRWRNPDALSREQTIRIHALSVAAAQTSSFERADRSMDNLIRKADQLADWIRGEPATP